ncbi:hypothetical protein D9757_007020 [Collybiopsis confluens]|uniref:Rad4-domain-containing protein n=1 Tax=Collybiopsis confluens TaxID=2823264 RepID=A0A8H5HCE8_9AGAR|nr:hypothetical protein D9757_007020 [Collybiopsis confluens]
MSSPDRLIPLPDDGESDDEIDWEEVPVPDHPSHDQPLMEIVLRPNNEVEELARKRLNTMSYAERMLRINCHKIHTVLLLISARIRNKWLNDELLHARLLSLTPIQLQNSFSLIHSSRVPEAALRGRMFENAVTRLAEWWSEEFFEVADEGHIRNNTFDWMNQRLQTLVPGFEEVFQAALAPKEEPNHYSKYSAKGKQKEQSPPSTGPLFDSNDLDLLEDILDNSLETIKSPKSLMKHALMQSGSRDISAQLFTALCRALGIPARLVVSLQSVPWKASIGRQQKKTKKAAGKPGRGKGKEKSEEQEEQEELIPTVFASGSSSKDYFSGEAGKGRRLDDAPDMGIEKAKPPVKLRKSKTKGYVLGAGPGPIANKPKKVARDDPHKTPPTYWAEVFSRADSRWIPVDPIRGYVNKRQVFDPSPSSSNSSSSAGDNRLLYVIGFEEDGYGRDVTRRYAREFSAKIAKVQGGSGSEGRARMHWWESVVALVTRPFRLNRDDMEDSEFETAQLMEGMPTSIVGFKDHPLYVLPRHLKQHEAIYPPPAPAENSGSSSPHFRSGKASTPSYTPELGKFRGEAVYSRSSVISLKSPENWLRSEGRRVKEGEVPTKYAKIRASTIGKRREVEMIKASMREAQVQANTKGNGKEVGADATDTLRIYVDELEDGGGGGGARVGSGADVMQGLYARHQTELYIPDPVVNGVVPKNRFGNIDLYVKSMLPQGAVHMPFKGIVKIARKLQIDFAEAVTGFEFRKRKATPVVDGIVVAAEHEEIVLEAFLEAEREASAKARLKKEGRVLRQWTKLVHGLRIRRRLQEQYAVHQSSAGPSREVSNDVSTGKKGKKNPTGDVIVGIDESNGSSNSNFAADQENGFHQEHKDTPTGAGFLVEPADIVQPFRLPKLPQLDKDLMDDPHVQNRARFSKSDARTMIGGPGTTVLPDFETYDIDGNASNAHVQAEDDITSVAPFPKSMQELAQADDAIAHTRPEPTDPDGADKAQVYVPSESHEIAFANTESAWRSPRSTKNKRNDSVNGSGSTGVPSAKTVRSNTAPAARRRTKRKRRRSDDDDSDEKGGNRIGDVRVSPSPSKRSRRGKADASPPTRVLRPRAAKTKSELDLERENEDAYRSAINEN